jgi:cleavage and polyadenylation specificity factor subunit 1
MEPTEDNVRPILDFPKPTTAAEMGRYLGMLAYYHRFIRHCSALTAPLHELKSEAEKSKSKAIVWTESTEKSYEASKKALASATMLYFPVINAETRLVTDASEVAMGGVIEQKIRGHWRPLAFFSRHWSKAEAKGEAFRKELTAIKTACGHFRHILEGREFHVLTDHKPLVAAMHKKDPNWPQYYHSAFNRISEFTSDIRHLPGSDNAVADMLSRPPQEPERPADANLGAAMIAATSVESEFLDELAAAQRGVPELRDLVLEKGFCYKDVGHVSLVCITKMVNGIEVVRPVVPESMRHQVFRLIHDISHTGIKATRKLIEKQYMWPNMSADIKNWVTACIRCSLAKVQVHNKAPLQQFVPPSARFNEIHVDIVGPLPSCQGNTYLFTVIDRFSRWPAAMPMPGATAEHCAKALLHGWVANFGVPLQMTSDQGRQFESELWQQLMQLMGTERVRTTAYHPQANGAVERFHRTLKAALRTKLDTDNWVDILPVVLLGIRSAPKEDIGFSSAEIVYGAPLRLPGCYYNVPTAVPVNEVVRRAQEVAGSMLPIYPWHGRQPERIAPRLWETAHVAILDSSSHPSLQNPYKGPYKVIKRGAKSFVVQIGTETKSITVDRLKPMPTVEELLTNLSYKTDTEQPPTPPEIVPPTVTTRAGRTVKPSYKVRTGARLVTDDSGDRPKGLVSKEFEEAGEYGLV